MSPRDLLGIVVRATGLAFILFACFDLFHLFAKVLGLDIYYSQFSAGLTALGFVFWSVIGIAIIVFAKEIVRLAYWRDPLP
jgi:hypothetical protein